MKLGKSTEKTKGLRFVYIQSMKKTGITCIIILNNLFLLGIMPFLIAMFYAMFNIAGEGEGYAYDRYAITYETGFVYIIAGILPILIANIVINEVALKTFKFSKTIYIRWFIYTIQIAYFVFVLSLMNVI